MASTKIVNVQKDDELADLLSVIKSSTAEEIILIFPKSSKAARLEESFSSLAETAKSQSKTISVMSADEKVCHWAGKYGFKLLTVPNKPRSSSSGVVSFASINRRASTDDDNDRDSDDVAIVIDPDEDNVKDDADDEELIDIETGDDEKAVNENEKEDKEEEDESDRPRFDEEKEDADTLADLTMARINPRQMDDIKAPGEASNLKVRKEPSLSERVEIRHDRNPETNDQEELENMWLRRSDGTVGAKDSIWSNIKSTKTKAKRIGRHGKLIFSIAGVVVFLVAIYLFFGKATVQIKPQRQPIDFKLSASTADSYTQVDAVTYRIPGQFLSYTGEVKKDFPASGQQMVVKKARGEITVYNNYNSEPQNLITTTRFESAKSLIFRIQRSITVPGTRLINGKTTPGSVRVEIIADKPGEEYNIPAGKFTIPGFKGSPKFAGFYGESTTSTIGGRVGQAKVVTEKDIIDAKAAVSQLVIEQAKTGLLNQVNGLHIIEPIDVNPLPIVSTAQSDDAVDTFSVSAKAESATVVFRTEDIDKLIELYVGKNGQVTPLKGTINVEYGEPKLDTAKHQLDFTMRVSGQAASRIDGDKILKDISGLGQDKIKEFFLGIKEIDSVKVLLSPFWVRSIPKNQADIKLELIYQ